MCELVSIITPAYNAEMYIKFTIESVLHQDYENWEMVIVDDSSKDNTKLIVDEFMRLDSRIKLISLSENKGVAYARNIGLKEAKGKYVAFLDSDDLWYPYKLSTQIDFMKKNGYVFTFSSYEIIDSDGKKKLGVVNAPQKVDYNRLLKGNPIGCLTVVLDREKIGNIAMPNIKHEDYATWLEITKRGFVAYGISEPLALYRKSKTSVSSNKLKSALWTWNVYRHHQKFSFMKSSKCLFWYICLNLTKSCKMCIGKLKN